MENSPIIQEINIAELELFEATKKLVEEQLSIELSILEQRVLRSIYVPLVIQDYPNRGRSYSSFQPKVEAGFRFLTGYFPVSFKLAKLALLAVHPRYASGELQDEYQRFLATREEMHKP